MGEDIFNLTSGDLYTFGADQQYIKVGSISSAQIDIDDIYEETIDPVVNDFVHALSNLEASFEYTARLTEEAIMAILGLRIAVLGACPNKRVVYLADHAKKKRTRKKNFHRAVKILERG